MSIKVKNLNFSYGKKSILCDINFSIESNCLVSLLGKNGVGKSTLLKCMLNVLKIEKDTIFLDDIDITSMSKNNIAKKISYIPQTHNPNFNYRVLDIVVMGLSAKINTFTTPSKKDYEKAMIILNNLGIANIAQDGYMRISGGQRQLVLIARALLQDAKIIIMDEPTSNLDYGNQIKILEKIEELSKNGYTVIISTHNPQHAITFCEKSIVLDDGKLIFYGNTNRINEELLKKIYGIDMQMILVDDIPVCLPKIMRG